MARNRLEGLLQNTLRSFTEFGWMLSARDQDFVRVTIENARAAATSEDTGAVRHALEDLETAARLITDAMFRPTALTPGGDTRSQEEEKTPLSEMS